MTTSINAQLKALYEDHYGLLKVKFNEQLGPDMVQATNPLLICLPNEEKYRNSDVKIMFFGQETNDWELQFGKSIGHLLDTYRNYFGAMKDHQQHRPFWKMVKEYAASVQDKDANLSVDYSWNNILKVGKAKGIGEPMPEIVRQQQLYFPVIQAELEILKPDIVIFFTGPNYDHHIKHEFPDAQFIGINDLNPRQICQVKSQYLPSRSYRTYHPGYLARGNQHLFEKFKNL